MVTDEFRELMALGHLHLGEVVELVHLRDVDAEMLVMGAYGHSRFREAILGGATRYMLESAEVPIFLAH